MWTQCRVLKTELVIEKYFSISIKALHIRGLTLAADASGALSTQHSLGVSSWPANYRSLPRGLLITAPLVMMMTCSGVRYMSSNLIENLNQWITVWSFCSGPYVDCVITCLLFRLKMGLHGLFLSFNTTWWPTSLETVCSNRFVENQDEISILTVSISVIVTHSKCTFLVQTVDNHRLLTSKTVYSLAIIV